MREQRRNIPTLPINLPVAENEESQWHKTEFQLSHIIFFPQDLPTGNKPSGLVPQLSAPFHKGHFIAFLEFAYHGTEY